MAVDGGELPSPRARAAGASRPLWRRRAAAPVIEIVPSLALAVSALLFLLVPAARIPAAPFPFLAALIVLGLPHGAADGALLMRLATAGRRTAVAGIYLVLMAATFAALLWVPRLTLGAFLGVAWLHFGTADAEGAFAEGDGARIRRLWAFGRGGLVVALPFAVAPERAWEPFERLAGLVGAGSAGLPPAPLGLFGGLAALAAVAAVVTVEFKVRRRGLARPSAIERLETGLLAAVCLIADPLFAVGVYFLLVHGLRQSVQLGRGLAPGATPGVAIGRVHLAALPLLLPTWAGYLAVARWTGAAAAYELAVLTLLIYVVATLPHELLQRTASQPMTRRLRSSR